MKKLITLILLLFTVITFGQKKAIEINGQIKIYNQLPRNWNNIKNFKTVDKATLEGNGFYDVVEPIGLRDNEYKGNIYLDTVNKVYVYNVLTRTQAEIDTLRANKIRELKLVANAKLEETTWYYIRELRLAKGGKNNKPVPTDVINKDMRIYEKTDSLEVVINSLTTYKQIVDFQIKL